MIVDGVIFARAFLGVALASGTDQLRPQLCRTVHVEEHHEGLRLIATDATVLLRTWVPSLSAADSDPDSEPGPDEAPIATATLIDPHGRAKGLAGHVLKVGTDDDADPIDLRVRLGVTDTDHDQATLDGLEAEFVVLELPDEERLRLPVYDGRFPEWRKLTGGFRAQSTDAVALNPQLVGRLAKLGRLFPGQPLVWRFGGRDAAAHVAIEHPDGPRVEGLAMPVRWDLDADAPAEQPDEADR